MCQHLQDDTPITLTDQDFDGIQHHNSLKDNSSDHEVFGIWATVRNQNSNLNEFGVRVTRTLTVDPVNRISNEAIEDFIEDRIRIETTIDGTASTNVTSPANTGTATWNGDLIAVHTQHFQPVLGDATLSMDLFNTDLLQARFTNMERTDHSGRRHDLSDAAYALERSGDNWIDEQGRVNARFYAIGNDDTAAVAGRLDDASIHLIGSYGAIRNDVMVPPPPELPEPIEGDPIGN